MIKIRIHLRLPLRLRWRRRGVPARAARVTIAEAGGAALGPGWFDSSWELTHGLDVREGLPAHPSVNEWLWAALSPPAFQALPVEADRTVPPDPEPAPQPALQPLPA